jgi:ribosomal protein S18 acetylase RimI-like enzyme
MILRRPGAADVEDCGRIMHDAFRGIAERHAFLPDFPSREAAVRLAGALVADPAVFGVVAERGRRVVGSNFLHEADPIRAVGPITVDPAAQGMGIGRSLMIAVVERGRDALGVRLVQDAFNTRSISLYASLGFEVKEPLLLMSGRPRGAPGPRFRVRPVKDDDVDACVRLCAAVHGVARAGELENARRVFTPLLVERDGRVTGYLTAPNFWIANHGVAETEADMKALLLGAATFAPEPVALLLPTRQASLFRWCLDAGLLAVKPMTLMAMGMYREPAGCWFPSVFY